MNKRSPITTHVLDVSLGKPASQVLCRLEKQRQDERWEKLSEAKTNSDGRIEDWVQGKLEVGTYRLEFAVKSYFESKKTATFYPSVTVVFEVLDPNQHYHVPLLLSPFGYSTYRGT